MQRAVRLFAAVLIFGSEVLLSVAPVPVSASHAADMARGVALFKDGVGALLKEHCLECHSPDHKIKGELRLDTREGWMTGGELGAVIAPGKPEESLLIKAVRYADTKLDRKSTRLNSSH